MYGSSCGSPCLILHPCRECHNTFTSHSSTSSQGQAWEENCSCVAACVFSEFLHGCSMHMHVCLDCMYLHACDTCLLTGSYACLFMFIRVQTIMHLLVKAVVMLVNIIWTVAQDWAVHLTLINSSSIHSVYDNSVTKWVSRHLKVQSIV